MKNKNIKLLFCALLALLLIIGVASCKHSKVEAVETVAFTDALGREVNAPKNPKRVAALLGSFADVWLLSGGELVAAAEDAWGDFGLELGDAVNLGGAHSPNLELLLSANPDFVIASASTASHLEMRETLEAMGIAVADFDVDDFEDYLSMLEICTDLTGRKDLYEQNGLAIEAQIKEIKETYENASIPGEEKRVLLLRASSGFVKVKGSSGTILGEMLADMGCANIADHDASLLENLSVEAIMREEPHHVFVVAMGNNIDAARASFEALLKENPAWGELKAIKEGRVHWMDKRLFNLKPNSRWAESYEVLYETLITR